MKIKMHYFSSILPTITRLILLLLLLFRSSQISWAAPLDNPINECEPQLAPVTRIIKLGMSTALSGPIQHIGQAMRAGVIKRLNEENCDPFWRNQGTRFELITRDDGYIPAAAAENTRKLIEDDEVIALVGNLGTPTAERAWKIANDAGVLFYAAYTGTDILRQKPPAPFVVNYRASDHQAMNLIVTHIIAQGIPVKQIGVFLQDDAFGNGGLAAAHATLGNICGDCAQAILTMRYERNTLKVDEALRIFIEASPKPKAVILVGTTEPCAEFIRFAHRLAPTTRFYSLSSGRAKLAQLLPDIDDKIYFTQVTPPTSSNHNALDNEDALEGYLSTSFLMDAMRPISENISSASVRNSLISLEQKLAPEDRRDQHTNDQQLMDDVWLVPMKDVAQHSGTGE
ncbi:MAG: Extracellular ligand-binding receptor [Cellvibrio sp.]|nr:Extracellular ligand-binding receptor [Cellvibrio sp.]